MEEIGKTLLSRREELGFSLEQMSQMTHLTINNLKAIEAGDLGGLKEEVTYTYYFIKRYCKELDLDFETICEPLKEALKNL